MPPLVYSDHGVDEFGVPYIELEASVPADDLICDTLAHLLPDCDCPAQDRVVSVRFYPHSVVVGVSDTVGDGYDMDGALTIFWMLWRGDRGEFNWGKVWNNIIGRTVGEPLTWSQEESR